MIQMLAIGLNHLTASLAVRERLAFPGECAGVALAELRSWAAEVAPETALLSTCNRTEVYCASGDPQGAQTLILQWLAHRSGQPASELRPHLYLLAERDAVRHAFRVASGLDSMVLGETQILGQMKQAARRAHAGSALGAHLHHLFQRAFAVAKEVRSATGIGSSAVSMAAAAVRLAQQTYADLGQARVLFVGAGETIALAARHFAAQQPLQMTVATRSPARLDALAVSAPLTRIALASLPEQLEEHDVVVCGTASALPIVGLGMVERAMRARAGQPLVIVDLAVPRDVEPEAGLVPGVALYTVDDLARLVQCGLASRMSAVQEAEAIIARRVSGYMQWMAARRLLPLLRTLESRAEWLREAELARARRRLARGEDVDTVLGALAGALINKFLHTPRAQLGRGALAPEAAQALIEQWLPGLAAVRTRRGQPCGDGRDAIAPEDAPRIAA